MARDPEYAQKLRTDVRVLARKTLRLLGEENINIYEKRGMSGKEGKDLTGKLEKRIEVVVRKYGNI